MVNCIPSWLFHSRLLEPGVKTDDNDDCYWNIILSQMLLQKIWRISGKWHIF